MSSDNIIPKYFFSYTTKSIKGEDGVKRYPISSTNFDRDGDNMTVEFLNDIGEKINNGHVAFFTDHGMGPNGYYSALDKLGDWHDAVVTDNVLYASLRLRDKPVTPQLEQIIEILDNNIPTTFSIGFIPGEMEENAKGGYSFKSGDILETSAVGIPSNPDAVSGLTHIKAYMEAYQKSMIQKSEVEIMTKKEEKPDEEEQEEEKQEDEEEEDKSAPAITLDAMKAAVKEAVKEALKELKEEDEEEEEKEEDEPEDDKEDEEKADEGEEEEEEPEPKGKGAGTPEVKKEVSGPFKSMF